MRQKQKNLNKISIICLCGLLLLSHNAFAQSNLIVRKTLSPAITISNQNFQETIQNSIKPTDTPFLTRRPLDWEQKRIPKQWPKRTYKKAEFKLDKLTEDLMVYPKEMLNSPDLFANLDIKDPGIAYDKEHFEFNYQTGYWHSKDFPDLVLGTWEDIEKKFPSTSQMLNTRSKMKRHVVTRYKKLDTNKTISFYFFDNHAYSVPYALEAKQRGEIPDEKIDHIVVDQHSDNLKALNFKLPKDLRNWRERVEDDYIAMNSFHSVFGRLNMFSRLIWTFDGDAQNCTSRAKSVENLKKHAGCNTVKGVCISEYPNLTSRTKNASAFLNIDVDTTDQMLELDNDQPASYNRIVYPEETLSFYTDFLLQLNKDNVNIFSFHASTTNWFKRDDGDVETVRFLSRIAPAIILKSKTLPEPELEEFINKTVNQHKTKLTIGQRLKDKLEALSQSKKNNSFKINSLDISINQSI